MITKGPSMLYSYNNMYKIINSWEKLIQIILRNDDYD